MDAVWPDTAVEDNNLTVQISALRRVLDQGRTEGSCIQTIPGRGYRFVAAVPAPARRREVSHQMSPVCRSILHIGAMSATATRRRCRHRAHRPPRPSRFPASVAPTKSIMPSAPPRRPRCDAISTHWSRAQRRASPPWVLPTSSGASRISTTAPRAGIATHHCPHRSWTRRFGHALHRHQPRCRYASHHL